MKHLHFGGSPMVPRWFPGGPWWFPGGSPVVPGGSPVVPGWFPGGYPALCVVFLWFLRHIMFLCVCAVLCF